MVAYLEKSWLNEPMERNYDGGKITVILLDTIKPGLKSAFEVFEKQQEDDHYRSCVVAIDTLTLKVEGILRCFVERLGRSTFARHRDGGVMEKTFDSLIAELQATDFVEEHRKFIKYVMSEKIGWNLRNEVAHSLMTTEDYTPDKIIVLFRIILLLSSYTFVSKVPTSDPNISSEKSSNVA
jgi:hypothetical protein